MPSSTFPAAASAALKSDASATSDARGALPALHIDSSAALWFHPMPSPSTLPGGSPNGFGSADFLALFGTNAPWQRALAHTSTFGMYAGWVAQTSDQDLATVVGFLNAHNMGVELESPALQATATCGSGVEGYVPYGSSLHDFTLGYLQRLKALGANLSFLKVDEPFYFGSVVADPRSCHFSVPYVAQQVGQFAQLIKTVYPNAAVGDVEPVIVGPYSPDVVTAIGAWHDTYRKVTGTPFPFFLADLDFSNPVWPALARALENGTHERGMRSGIIYIGDYPDTTDIEWSGKAVARFRLYQGASGGRPDYVLFQSWQREPQFCLPENDPTTFTGVLDAYVDATTFAPRPL
ncbi:MAG TPA: hypothetical protein VKG44_06060 [Candidatus Baltobacteraceae bacterium]|nr:hypothetical protein [Candidatus Baltobacteraceae bacterium]